MTNPPTNRLSSAAMRWTVAGLVLAAFLTADFFTPVMMNGPESEWAQAILIGVCIGQVALIAVLAAMGPGNVVVRLPLSLLLVAWMWYALELGMQSSGFDFPPHGSALLGVVLFAGATLGQIPFWIARVGFGWRIASPHEDPAEPGPSGLQFHLAHLLIATTLVALALAPARVVMPQGVAADLALDRELPVLIPAVVITCLLATAPVVWGAFWPGRVLFPAVLGWLGYALVLTIVEIWTLIAILGRPGGSDGWIYVIIYMLNVSQGATVFVTLLIFRGLGFRLVRGVARAFPAAPTE